MEPDPSGGGDIVKKKRASKENEGLKTKVDKTPDVGGRLMCRPPVALKRPRNAIPFHIPHRKLLEKIEFKKKQAEPLTGFAAKRMALVRHTNDRRMSSFDSLTERSKGLAPSYHEMYEEPKRNHFPLPHHKVPSVVDQKQLIDKMRKTTDGSFIYLTYAVPKSSEMYTPYALKIVTFPEVDRLNFFTMSCKGVMQQIGNDAIYTSLDKWEAEYEMYCRLMRIKSFYYFRMWKGFNVWRKLIIFRKFTQARNYIDANLFILNPTLRNGLLDLQEMCVSMYETTFVDTADIENRWLFYFIEDQMFKMENVIRKIKNFRVLGKDIIFNACHGALLGKGFVVDETVFEGKDKKKRVQKSSYIEQANKKKFCERLSCYIILADYMMINMLHLLLTKTLEQMNHVFEQHIQFLPSKEEIVEMEDLSVTLEKQRPPDAPQLPFFYLYFFLKPSSLKIDPSIEVTLNILTQVEDMWREHTTSIKCFVADATFNCFTCPIINGKTEERICGFGPTLTFYLSCDEELEESRQHYYNLIGRSYEAAQDYCDRFNGLMQFYTEDVETADSTVIDERSLEVFRNWLEKYHHEIKTVEGVVDFQNLGMMRIDLTYLKKTALPAPTRLLELVEDTIPWIGKTKVDNLTVEVEDAMAFLEKDPVQTLDFVEYLEYVEKATEKVDNMEVILDYCKELYDMLEEYQISVAIEELNAYLGLSVQLGVLRNLVDKKIEDTTMIIRKFTVTMNKDISVLISEVGVIKDECMEPWLYDIESNMSVVIEALNDLNERLTKCMNKASEYKSYQKQFRMEVTRFDMLDEVQNDVKLRLLLWESVDSWAKTIEEWYHCDFNTLNVEDMNAFIAKNVKSVNQLEKGLPKNLIVPKLKDDVELMKDKMSVITYLRNPALRQRHWIKIETILNHKFKPDDVITLEVLENLKCFNYPNELQEVSGQASSEAGLESLLKKVEEAWKTLEFVVVPHKDSKDIYILGTTEEVQATLDESNININTISASRHVGPIKSRVDEWAKFLERFSKTLDEWMMCQQNWVYLEVIFSAPDIQRQLPAESKLFLIVDKAWKELMRRTAKVPLALEAANYPNLLEILQKNNTLLEQIMKCLESYLETKRVAFPRFYFLSNDELLDILAQTRNPHAVQPHLRKCFDAIAKLEFGVKEEDIPVTKSKLKLSASANLKKSKSGMVLTTDIMAMLSPEGERVPLTKGLKARGNVEDWLGKVEEAMVTSLRRIMKAALGDYQVRQRTDWVTRHPSQIVLAVSQIMWAKGVHDILDAKDEHKHKKIELYLKKCIGDLNDLAILIRSDLPKVTRLVLIALITIDVHARDTLSNIVSKKINDCFSFEWLKVLRYYWDDKIDDCVAKMSSASYVYGYEYLGASGVLVITPLTDKCYLCLMGALQLDLGGAPAGPAGTGKTETTKDLAKALAIQCVVFNCSEGLDYKMMGRFFSGLAQSGAWCCFDEFNRLNIEVLSVIAQQIITIRNAKAAKQTRFMFEGREIKLVHKCAAFITMNPGYAGRTELPDNLKALFRPISMMVPDYALIAEVILYSEGFESSRGLSQKMVQMYKLCSEQLSQQDHYDFGMRAVKSVLVMAGSLKRSNPDRSEDVVLICALRDSNLPKFLADDALLFQGILSDLFPGIELPIEDYGLLFKAIEFCLIEWNFQPVPAQIAKVIQLYETMIVRWGVMLVGPTGGGKTVVLKTLNRALTKMNGDKVDGPYYKPVHTYTLNPKAVTAGELYGEVNPFTMEWRDGLIGIMTRTAVTATNEDHQWIICDGPVDAVWIENLNTVLDDNKMLCLANSERIKLTPFVHMVFEVQDLAQASPATVSRCGMVYIDPGQLKWMPYVLSWLNRLNDTLVAQEYKDQLRELFENLVEKCLIFVRKNCTSAIPQVDISKITMICALIESFFKMPGAMEKIGEKRKVRQFVCQTFIFSYIWGIGGNLHDSGRDKLESFIMSQFDENPDAKLQGSFDLWEVYINIQRHALDPWSKIIPDFKYNKEVPFFEMLVPTIDTIRFGFVMERLIYVNRPVLLTGDTGVGKSVVAKAVLNKLYETGKFVPVTMNFSAQTSSARTQEIIELKLERKKKTLLGAPVGKRIVIFVDDVNMPKLEIYGAQPPIELLRQFLDHGGLYDREKLFWKKIEDVVIAAGCAPPGGGRNPLTPRFVRHFGMLLIPPPNEFTLKAIFKAILKGFLREFANEVRDLGENMVGAAVEVYQRIETDLLPTPMKSHYVFNLRDLSKCMQGVCQADSGTVREELAMLKLFYHECLRVFHDRLINVEDKSYFYFLMKEVCQRNFGTPVLTLPEVAIIDTPPALFFGDFMRFGAEKKDRIYEEITNIDKMRNILQDYMDDYSLLTAKEMKLIFFMDALEHVVRIARILRAERGNALLVGVGGMGKQSLTKLGSHVNGYKCSQIELTRNYDHSSFFEDLRRMLFAAGALKEDTVFLFTDTQIIQEEMLEDINNILNSGEVPNLFESDEYEKVIITCRDPAKEVGINPANRDGIFDFFTKRVRAFLHLVICMSPVGDAFRRRCRMFPSLVNNCTIDWFEKWPREALLSVAQNSLQNLGDESMVTRLSNLCVIIHESVENMTVRFYEEMRRRYYTTPSSYLELLKSYLSMLVLRRDLVTKMRDRIANGLKKLYETNAVIDSMKETLTELEPILAKKSKEVGELMIHLEKEQKQADKVAEVVKGDEEIAKGKADETQAIADDAQRDLDTALPALEAATKALEALNKNDINELKVFQKPPKLVQFVMEAICLLLGAKTDWASAKVVLGDTNFLKRLQDYDKNHIPEKILQKLKHYVENPDFIPEKVANVSRVAKSMCMWARAIDMYARVYKIVEPKRKRLEIAEKELNQTMGLLREKQRQLAEVEAMIARLEAQFTGAVNEKQALEDNMALTAARLNRAGRLNVALGDEQTRWEETVQTLENQLLNVIGDVLVAAGSVAYLGAFTSKYRNELTDLWVSMCKEYAIPSCEQFSLIGVLADAYEIRQWNTAGLPRDTVSTENAILVTRSGRWSLMIDPQEQANRWIKQMELPNNLKIIKLTDPNFLRILEMAIRLGYPVLLEEVGETLDPTLSPILLRQTFQQGGRTLIRLGDSDIEYDNNFRFFITTKLANPHYLPEICIQVTIVNFTVTPSGLEDQLLANVVSLERPDLENMRSELIIRINADKAQLKAIEDKILRMLDQSEGNILDDEELIETLNESKETSEVIAARLIETESTEIKISVAREKYRSVATRGSVMYFVVAQLAEIDPMYQYSLKYFTQIFNTVIETSEKSENLDIRLEILIREITLSVYTNVSRGLFERHKLVFSFLLCIAILTDAGVIKSAEWNFLLRGPVGASVQVGKRPDYPQVTEIMWLSTHVLETISKNFKGLPDDIENVMPLEVGDYKLDIKVIPTAKDNSPIPWNERLTDFEKLMFLKTLKEEKLVFAITEFVKMKLGQAFIESPQVSLQLLYQDTSNTVPLVFILSTGSDPFGSFMRFATEMGFSKRVQSISLGQGQGPVAEKLIDQGLERGDWIFLQNCHLCASWMLPMERLILKIAEEDYRVHKDFRLYLSSMPSTSFPVAVLQNSVKVTNEPPKGLRANIKRAFLEMTEDFFEGHILKQDWRTMIFGLCMFHAIIQERKKFGPLGWNIVYEFNDSDREFAFNTLKMYCADGVIPWKALEYLTGEITYGGRVTDYWDLRCLKTILKIFFAPHTLKAGYQYSPSGTYYCPRYEKLHDYRSFIDELPILEEPEIFGMHENANIAFQKKETEAVILTILESQPRTAGGGTGKSSDEIVYELADYVIEQILTKIDTDEINPYLLKKDDKDRYQSLTTVLLQEIDRYNILLSLIHRSMGDLKKAIKGLVVMSEELEEVYKAFINNQVPNLWSKKSYNSLKSLGSWIKDLVLRLDFICTWVRSGHPTSYWLSGFFFPQGFLTGTLQTHARKYNLPIDQLKFDFFIQQVLIDQEVVKEAHDEAGKENYDVYLPLKAPKDGVIIHGLFIDAGRWDTTKQQLVDAKPGEINPSLPSVMMVPTTKMPDPDPRYECPLYKTSIRAGVLSTTGHSTNFVIAVLLPSAKNPHYWILKGTALLTQITN
ncbi:dynein axonemal heavy chain 6 [Coccinella septempunctata]|uniref:dynein axonemal heavy chain 6 n=1 Tax=Coccinella septempunctata TaxID=41139 RepID=UPI001D073E09|nr:dynein axonemal heavy chain 6 [Coccinella septempunctata]